MTREIRLTLNLFFIFVLAWQFCYCQLIDDEDLINNFFSSGTPILNTTITTEKELIDSIFNNQTLNNDNVIVVSIFNFNLNIKSTTTKLLYISRHVVMANMVQANVHIIICAIIRQ